MQGRNVFEISGRVAISPGQGTCYITPGYKARILCVAAKTNPFKDGEVRLLTEDKSEVTCQECLELIHA